MTQKPRVAFQILFTLFIILYSLSLFSTYLACGQEIINFSREDQFYIPAGDSIVSFATNGTYEQANLENGIWFFKNLKLGSSQNTQEVNLEISAQHCQIRILSCQIFHGSFVEHEVLTARIRYSIVGEGSQSFNLGLDPNEGDWNVIVNQEYKAENRDWQLSSDNTLTINRATGNVTLIYYGYPQSYIATLGSKSVLDNHHVSIIVSIALAILILLAAIAMAKARRTES